MSNKHHFAILTQEQEKFLCQQVIKVVNKNKLTTISGEELVFISKNILTQNSYPVAKTFTPQYLRKMFLKHNLTCPNKLYQKSQRHQHPL